MGPIQPSSSGAKGRIRMKDVAERLGVSVSTVSLVLSGDPRIPEDTVRRVLQAVKAMEYRPSVVARNLARKVSRTVVVILPEIAFTKNQGYFFQALQGIHSQTQPAGYKMIVEAANRIFLARRYYLRFLKEQSADGLLYLAAGVSDKFLGELEKESYPILLLGSTADGVQLPSIKGDDLGGAKLATKHLIGLGHKKIGHVAGSADVSNGRDRRVGYQEAMKEGGLHSDPAWVAEGDFDMASAEAATPNLVNAGVTAIFAASDEMAYGVLRSLKKIGKRVPEDMAVIGMDDIEMSAWMNPSLSTVRYDIRTMAEQAARNLIRRIQTPVTTKANPEETPPVQLVVRESCGGKKA